MKKINLDLKILFLLWVLLLIAIIPTYAHHGNFLYDCGREAYYPTQILAGKVLYKDIFNLYGPFAYMFNAVLYKLFGINLNVLYIAGCVSAFFIVSLTYLISRLFLSKFLSFSIAFFTISVGVLNLSLFNLIFPYSYGMLYGLVAFMFSVWFLLNYQKNPNKVSFLYLSSFFAGICAVNKYEFWTYSLVIVYSVFRIKRLIFKEYLLTFISFISVPFLCFGILFLQGLSLNDLILTLNIIKKTMQSDSLKHFYFKEGVFPNKVKLMSIFINGLVSLSTFTFFVLGFINVYKETYLKKILGLGSIFLSVSVLVYFMDPELFIFLPFLFFILLVLRFKPIFKNDALFILCLSAITLGLKNLFGILPLTYGLFYISFWVLTVLVIGFSCFKCLESKDKMVGIFLLIVSMLFAYVDLSYSSGDFQTKSYPLKTSKGVFYLDEGGCEIVNGLLNYLNVNATKTDKVVVAPEGTMINFLADRESDDYLNLLTPVMFDVFGEQAIIERFNQVNPEYVIFHDNSMSSDYIYNNICVDYAFEFCTYVKKNYKFEERIGGLNFSFYVYKRKL